MTHPAFAGRLKIAGMGLVNASKPQNGATVSSFGGGGQVEWGLTDRMGIELAGYFLPRAATAQSSVTYAEGTLALRFWFNRIINAGIGGYYAYPLTAASGDYGGLLMYGYNLPVKTYFSIPIEIRTTYGPVSQIIDIQGLIGVRFGAL